MATITCALEGLATSNVCDAGKGVRRAFVAQRSLIDWDAMLADPLKFDPATLTILDYEFLTGGKFVEIDFERDTSTFTATRTGDNGFYEVITSLVLLGNDVERTNALRTMIACCDLVVHLIMANGTERVLGVDYDGEVFDRPIKKFRIDRHLDTAGQFGGDEARDELDFGGNMEFAPLYATVGTTALRSYGVAAAGVQAYGQDDDVYGQEDDAYGPEAVSGAETQSLDTEAAQDAADKGDLSETPKTSSRGKSKK